MSVNILVIGFDIDKGLGRLALPLDSAGVRTDVRLADAELPDPTSYDGLIALPGLADPVDETPPVHRARAAIAAAIDARLPVLGLCLGGQLVAEACGGSAYRCVPERGFQVVEATPAAAGDPLLSALPERLAIFQAHGFAFEPPAGATILARNDTCVQAMRHGDRTWAIQCHPEPTLAWVIALAAGIADPSRVAGVPARTAAFFREAGVDPDELTVAARQADRATEAVAQQMAAGFAGVCRSFAGYPDDAESAAVITRPNT